MGKDTSSQPFSTAPYHCLAGKQSRCKLLLLSLSQKEDFIIRKVSILDLRGCVLAHAEKLFESITSIFGLP